MTDEPLPPCPLCGSNPRDYRGAAGYDPLSDVECPRCELEAGEHEWRALARMEQRCGELTVQVHALRCKLNDRRIMDRVLRPPAEIPIRSRLFELPTWLKGASR